MIGNLYLFFNVLEYFTIHELCNKLYPNNMKVAKNLVHLIHAITCIMLIYFDQIQLMSINTYAFYAYDIMCIVWHFKTNQIPFIIHHIMSIYTMYYVSDDIIGQHVVTTLLMFEISNLPLYIYYHFKTNGCSNIFYISIVEIIAYIGIRIVWFNCYVHSNMDDIMDHSSYIIKCIFVLISIMNIVWSIKLSKPFLFH